VFNSSDSRIVSPERRKPSKIRLNDPVEAIGISAAPHITIAGKNATKVSPPNSSTAARSSQKRIAHASVSRPVSSFSISPLKFFFGISRALCN
jgi:hypothetical protein